MDVNDQHEHEQEYEELRNVKKKYSEFLFSIPDVTAVGITYKKKNGKYTDELAITIRVKKKIPLQNIPKDQQIPYELDGFKTDVVETTYFSAILKIPENEIHTITSNNPKDKFRPIIGGISIGPDKSIGGFYYVGTLGMVIKARGDKNVILSNHHVLNPDNNSPRLNISQPSRVDLNENNNIVGRVIDSLKTPSVDAGIAEVSVPFYNQKILNEPGTVGLSPSNQIFDPASKVGRTTGRTYDAYISDLDLDVWVEGHHFINQIECHHRGGRAMSLPGDSGSVVFSFNHEAFGLLHAGGNGGSIAVCNRMSLLKDVFRFVF